MIQNIEPEIYSPEYTPQKPEQGDVVFVFSGRKILAHLDEEKKMTFPTVGMFDDADLQFLFHIGEKNYYMMQGHMECLQGYDYENVFKLSAQKDSVTAFAGMTAYHLYTWYSSHKYCGKCGQPLTHSKKERALSCEACGHRVYPVIAPAVIIGVIHGDEILVTRYADRAYKGIALLAGFCEIGESAEDTVRREVMEEVGLKIKNIRYFDSQPWGVDSNLLLGYFAEVDGSTEIHMDTNELREAVWMHREELKPAKNLMSLTMTMIEHFRIHMEP